jgi:hypothetical protein
MKNYETPVFIHIPKTGGTSILKCLNNKNVIIVDHLNKKDLSCFCNNWVFTFIRDPFDRAISAYRESF